MEIHRSLWLLVCLLNAQNTFVVSISYIGLGLTSIPDEIDPSVSNLEFFDNSISIITKSNFNDKYPDLADIVLDKNSITAVERGCFKGTALREISFVQNRLTVFPDFREVKETLGIVLLDQNNIGKISRAEMDFLTRLSHIALSDNPLVQLPPLTRLLPSLTDLKLRNIELKCCSCEIWLKVKPNTLTLDLNSEPCTHPSKWNMTKWENITEDMLLQQTCGESIEYMCDFGLNTI
ncbi:hypothetical protein CAPTEDRAFT_217863 [Capitella teleta]|uniref:LRRCT domain-containing protein n=1 Tax=Capitella teleta TaxID=283909 RepID=R7VLM5_CAPTE|nr:hypothetical protein CAPTEDRAFT_217863 [Capitella teleta]|eukprot:ELU17720.1 hypothetical protein CAPTEDRAFT_217863 [Capitella teleta]